MGSASVKSALDGAAANYRPIFALDSELGQVNANSIFLLSNQATALSALDNSPFGLIPSEIIIEISTIYKKI